MTDVFVSQPARPDHISVCICTFKRPEMLAHALEGVASQVTGDAFSCEVVVVDNDRMRSAEDIVKSRPKNENLHVRYDCEPEQNIALARNRAVRNSTGNHIAFIDDDESPDTRWLVNMHRTLKENDADGVLGPVLPFYPPGTPDWLEKSRLCERKRNTTGSLITGKDMRTGNILFQRHVFDKDGPWFIPARGRTGGEDGEFLSRQIAKGRRFVWCDEGVVFESVPEDRWRLTFYLKKELRIGTLTGEILRTSRPLRHGAKSCLLVFAYILLLPFSFIWDRYKWMRILVKLSYHTGLLLSLFGISLLRYRQ